VHIAISNAKRQLINTFHDIKPEFLQMLFLGGASWPQSNIVPFWKAISYLFPSTHGVQGIIKINTMQANLYETGEEFAFLWGLSAFYFVSACCGVWVEKKGRIARIYNPSFYFLHYKCLYSVQQNCKSC
jgi:ABC-type multidrug transport system permease subunit